MYPITLQILALILLVEEAILAPSRNFDIVFNGMTCEKYVNSSIKHFECEMIKLSNNLYGFSVELIFNKSYKSNLDVHYYIQMKPLTRNVTLRFIDLRLNVCEAVHKAYDIPLLQQLIIQLRKTSNVPFQCPFKENFLYHIKNLTFSDLNLNNIMPFVHFTQGLDFYESTKLLCSLKTMGSILPKSKKKKTL